MQADLIPANVLVPRRIVCAAVKYPRTDKVFLCIRHFDEFTHSTVLNDPDIVPADYSDAIQGFVDQYGVFLDRYEAWKVAEAAEQIIRRVGGDTINGGKLFSENLY